MAESSPDDNFSLVTHQHDCARAIAGANRFLNHGGDGSQDILARSADGGRVSLRRRRPVALHT